MRSPTPSACATSPCPPRRSASGKRCSNRERAMSQFKFHAPANAGDATKLFKTSSDPRFVAGGQSLLPTIRMGLADPSDLIDLHGLADLASIRASGSVLSIGAMTTHAAVAESAEVRRLIPAL